MSRTCSDVTSDVMIMSVMLLRAAATVPVVVILFVSTVAGD